MEITLDIVILTPNHPTKIPPHRSEKKRKKSPKREIFGAFRKKIEVEIF